MAYRPDFPHSFDAGRLRYLAVMTASAIAAGALPCAAQTGDGLIDELFSPYMQRVEGVTAGAGNASAANTAAMAIDPSPRKARNRSIPFNGERMAGAYHRYRDVKKLRETPPTLSPDITGGGASSAPAPSTEAPPASGK